MSTLYTTVDLVRSRLGITGLEEDEAIESVILAASREIDGLCSRSFYQLEATTRYYTPDDWSCLDIDDLVTVTTFKTDDDGDETYETSWDATDYRLGPRNAADTASPFTQVTLKPNGRYGFPRAYDSVEILGTFGWPAVPAPIAEACVLQSVRLFKRRDAPYGLVGSAELGQQTFVPGRVDPQVASLVAPFRKLSPVGVV